MLWISARLWVLIFLLTIHAIPSVAQIKAGKENPDNLVGHGGPIKALAIEGNRVLTGSFDYSAGLWALGSTNRLVYRYADHDGAVNAVAFVPEKNRFVTAGDDGAVYLWNGDNNELLFRFEGHQGKVVALAVSEDGKIAASASWDSTIRLWDLENFKELAVFKGHTGLVNSVLITDDGEYLYSAGYDGVLMKWSLKANKLERRVYRHGWGINVMKWLPGKQRILFGSLNGDVQIYDLESDSISKVLIPHKRPVLALATSRDGKLLASGGGDGLIRVWDTSSWSVVEELYSLFGPIWAMDFTADNRKILYTGLDDYAVAWPIRPRKISAEVQSNFPRRFQKTRDMSLGERQFARKCSICHSLKPGDKNRAGPTLFGIFGRVAGTLKGYKYSAGLVKSDIVWNEDTINQLFALGPQHVTPGSKMPLQKIARQSDRDALIVFLKQNTR